MSIQSIQPAFAFKQNNQTHPHAKQAKAINPQTSHPEKDRNPQSIQPLKSAASSSKNTIPAVPRKKGKEPRSLGINTTSEATPQKAYM